MMTEDILQIILLVIWPVVLISWTYLFYKGYNRLFFVLLPAFLSCLITSVMTGGLFYIPGPWLPVLAMTINALAVLALKQGWGSPDPWDEDQFVPEKYWIMTWLAVGLSVASVYFHIIDFTFFGLIAARNFTPDWALDWITGISLIAGALLFWLYLFKAVPTELRHPHNQETTTP